MRHKTKFCIIRKVKYRTQTNRLVWANVISDGNGTALLLVPKSTHKGNHSLVFARENAAEQLFEAADSSTLETSTADLLTIGKAIKFLGTTLMCEDWGREIDSVDSDNREGL